ncbi:MAG TPA: nuclease-related domain-containing protein [Opitutaceae bacterium]|nr:nuclease-related domain-containing protein [Opitutaceae bacterium]
MPITYTLLFLTGYFLVFCLSIAACWYVRSRLQRRRAPIQEKLLRLPGETLEKESEKLESRFVRGFLIAAAFPLIPFGLLSLEGLTVPLWALIPVVVVAMVGIYFSVKKLWDFLEHRSDNQLGLRGERAVAEQLHKLLNQGFQVFHDFPGDSGKNGWSIDHIVVGPQGVFSIETKTCRRGGKVLSGRSDNEIIFDGDKLQYPWGEDNFGLEKAHRNAAQLSQWLTHAVGERITARPLLAFPGWHVTRRARGPVLVLNHKELPLVIEEGTPQLSPPTIERIAFHLEQRCRDVEF